jgi:hypothetical protein
MARTILFLALAAATSPALANAPAAPGGTADTRYCMRIVATGTLLEPVKCWTREEWAAQGVDVDRDWARNGVRTRD